jgi:hypothetical protein
MSMKQRPPQELGKMQEHKISAADFSPGLFWEIDTATLDFEKHIHYIVNRILDAGTIDDWNLLCRHLSLQGVVNIAQKLRSLDPRSLAFLSVVGRIPKEQFRCFTQKPLTGTHWIF